MAIHSMQQVLEYVENEKLEQVIMAAERKHKEIAARTANRHEKQSMYHCGKHQPEFANLSIL